VDNNSFVTWRYVEGRRRTRRGDTGGDSAYSLLHEIDQALIIARGFLTATSQPGWFFPLKSARGSGEMCLWS
jgi:hypothetical protein